MRWTKTYSDSPAKAFDAVEDVKFYLGDRYERARKALAQMPDPFHFRSACENMLGIEGYPVEALFGSIFGQGAYAKHWPKALEAACRRAHAQGMEDGRERAIYMNLEVHEAYKRGIAQVRADREKQS